MGFWTAMIAHPLTPAAASHVSLLNAPVDLIGNWGASAPQDAGAVIRRMRDACLSHIALVSDRQPDHVRVDEHPDGYPAIWLHSDNPTTAWIIVDVGPNDWCKLAYQFGHELGHVLANSWTPDAKPLPPCQWLEEAIVEAFSLRGLTRLALSWEQAPPFPHNEAFGASIRSYRDNVLRESATLAASQGMDSGFIAWFQANREFLEVHGTVNDARGAVPLIFGLLESDSSLVADIGALNRWPGRTGIPLSDYLARWTRSCTELGAPGRLPAALAPLLSPL
jgi:hypothetical protein